MGSGSVNHTGKFFHRKVTEAMGCYIYSLFSTEDGDPRYVGQTSEKVRYRFKKHVTAALEHEPGALYDWMRDVWRRKFDVDIYILQEDVVPKDLDMFEQYWIDQFSNLLNIRKNSKTTRDSAVAKEIRAHLKTRLQVVVTENLPPR